MPLAGSCLCVLCGLPAAGKSRLAETLRGRAQSRGWATLLVTYDALIPARDWRETEWKQHRKTVLMCLERLLHQTHTHTEQTHTHTEQTHTEQTHTHTEQTHTHTEQTHTHTQCEHDAWMQFKQIHTQHISCHSHTQPLLVLLDDNFYYQSMRFQIYQLARKYSMGFCQVFLQCPLDVCLQRNRQRSLRVPDEVLLQMSERMEPPDKSRNGWEQPSLRVDTTHSLTDADVHKLMDLLESALGNPLSPIQDDSQQKVKVTQTQLLRTKVSSLHLNGRLVKGRVPVAQLVKHCISSAKVVGSIRRKLLKIKTNVYLESTEADRQICASNALHQADQTCRRLISGAMTSARENQASSEVLKVLAKELNGLKTHFLQQLKRDVLQTEEPISTEKLLMTAARAFEQQTQDCVQTLIKQH